MFYMFGELSWKVIMANIWDDPFWYFIALHWCCTRVWFCAILGGKWFNGNWPPSWKTCSRQTEYLTWCLVLFTSWKFCRLCGNMGLFHFFCIVTDCAVPVWSMFRVSGKSLLIEYWETGNDPSSNTLFQWSNGCQGMVPCSFHNYLTFKATEARNGQRWQT